MLARIAMMALIVTLGACTGTTYRTYDQTPAAENPLGRDVTYLVDKRLFRDPPGCVTVVAADGQDSPLFTAIEDALARHLSGRFSRVIGAKERRRLARQRVLDLGDARDRRTFARAEGCRAFALWRATEAASDYVLVWSRQRIGLEVAIVEEPGTVLWQATHVASRSDGGLPVSPLSVAFSAFEATRFHGDQDVPHSMIDDVLRRIFETLPDLR